MRLKFITIGCVILLVSGITLSQTSVKQNKAVKDLTAGGSIPVTPERLERGRYLFQAVANCDRCHSLHDYMRYGAPVIPAGRGQGMVLRVANLPGRIVPPNITPDKETGIGTWTDAEKMRAIRDGVGRDGHALTLMSQYRTLSDEDLKSIVVYINSLPPIKNKLPPTVVPSPEPVPKPVEHVPEPSRKNKKAYGAYLVGIAACGICHTPAVREGEFTKDYSKPFAGGQQYHTPLGAVASANITPDKETGIGNWTEEQFKAAFMRHRNYGPEGPPKIEPGKITVMSWPSYAQMTPEDLSAIYAFLRSQRPIKHKVEKHPKVAATPQPTGQ